jgi:hypothetical protein
MGQGVMAWIRRLLSTGKKLEDLQQTPQQPEKTDLETSDTDAVFLGWERTPTGKYFALYSINAKKPSGYHPPLSENKSASSSRQNAANTFPRQQ